MLLVVLVAITAYGLVHRNDSLLSVNLPGMKSVLLHGWIAVVDGNPDSMSVPRDKNDNPIVKPVFNVQFIDTQNNIYNYMHPGFRLCFYPIKKKDALEVIIRDDMNESSCAPVKYYETSRYYIVTSSCESFMTVGCNSQDTAIKTYLASLSITRKLHNKLIAHKTSAGTPRKYLSQGNGKSPAKTGVSSGVATAAQGKNKICSKKVVEK
jgi:hypothetical protein